MPADVAAAPAELLLFMSETDPLAQSPSRWTLAEQFCLVLMYGDVARVSALTDTYGKTLRAALSRLSALTSDEQAASAEVWLARTKSVSAALREAINLLPVEMRPPQSLLDFPGGALVEEWEERLRERRIAIMRRKGPLKLNLP